MKIHYKTIINQDKRYREVFGEETYLVVHTTKNVSSPLKIDYCCDEMKKAITSDVLDVQEAGNSTDKNGICLYLKENDYDGSFLSAWYYHPLKFCPFCSEEITLVEDYKAKQAKRKVHIPAKTTPARSEIRTYEIKI